METSSPVSREDRGEPSINMKEARPPEILQFIQKERQLLDQDPARLADFAGSFLDAIDELHGRGLDTRPGVQAYLKVPLLKVIREHEVSLNNMKPNDLRRDEVERVVSRGLGAALNMGLDRRRDSIGDYIRRMQEEMDQRLRSDSAQEIYLRGLSVQVRERLTDTSELVHLMMDNALENILTDDVLKDWVDELVPKIISNLVRTEGPKEALDFFLRLPEPIRQREYGLVLGSIDPILKGDFINLYKQSLAEGKLPESLVKDKPNKWWEEVARRRVGSQAEFSRLARSRSSEQKSLESIAQEAEHRLNTFLSMYSAEELVGDIYLREELKQLMGDRIIADYNIDRQLVVERFADSEESVRRQLFNAFLPRLSSKEEREKFIEEVNGLVSSIRSKGSEVVPQPSQPEVEVSQEPIETIRQSVERINQLGGVEVAYNLDSPDETFYGYMGYRNNIINLLAEQRVDIPQAMSFINQLDNYTLRSMAEIIREQYSGLYEDIFYLLRPEVRDSLPAPENP